MSWLVPWPVLRGVALVPLSALLAASAACCTAQQAGTTAPTNEPQGAAAVTADAGAGPTAAAPGSSMPATDPAADASSSAATEAMPVELPAAAEAQRGADVPESPFDRILVKPRIQGTTAEDVKVVVEQETGLAVVRVRRTAGSWYLVQLAPAEAGRSPEAQRALLQKLLAGGEFEHVEADRLVQVKAP